MFLTHLVFFEFFVGAGPVVAVVPDVPGIEWTAPDAKLHYTAQDNRIHWTAPDED